MHLGRFEKHQVWPNGDSAGETRTDPPLPVRPIRNPPSGGYHPQNGLKLENYPSFLDIYDPV